jgi:hypothetical protein
VRLQPQSLEDLTCDAFLLGRRIARKGRFFFRRNQTQGTWIQFLLPARESWSNFLMPKSYIFGGGFSSAFRGFFSASKCPCFSLTMLSHSSSGFLSMCFLLNLVHFQPNARLLITPDYEKGVRDAAVKACDHHWTIVFWGAEDCCRWRTDWRWRLEMGSSCCDFTSARIYINGWPP